MRVNYGSAVSMDALQKIYGIGINDWRYRYKLKKKPMEWFPNKLLFLTTKRNTTEILVSAKDVSYVLSDDTSCVVEFAKCLHTNFYNVKSCQTSWPPMTGQLSTELLELVTLLMKELVKTERHNPSRSENIRRLIQSIWTDLVYGVSREDMISAKHFLLALVHNIKDLLLFWDTHLRNTISFNNLAEVV